MPSDRTPIVRLAPLFVIGFLLVNGAFYVLSGSYFESHHQLVGGESVPLYSPAEASHVRMVFAAMSGAIAAVAFIASLARRVVGHALAALLGLANLVFGALAASHGQPGALTSTLLITGVVVPALAVQSYRRSRAAWAFLVALCGVFAVVGLFGAPKVRGVLDVSLWTTMIFPGLYLVASATLAQLRDDYLDTTPVRARA
ncbi:MAG TPA: hypothetical protein VHW23_36590 [Kofleriaceae bacterium]|nr:hypothetical protein [Kofleriaceae bacterium]